MALTPCACPARQHAVSVERVLAVMPSNFRRSRFLVQIVLPRERRGTTGSRGSTRVWEGAATDEVEDTAQLSVWIAATGFQFDRADRGDVGVVER